MQQKEVGSPERRQRRTQIDVMSAGERENYSDAHRKYNELGLRCSTNGPEHTHFKPVAVGEKVVGEKAVDDQAHVSALQMFCTLPQGQMLHFLPPSRDDGPWLLIAHYGPRYQLHKNMWTFYVNRMIVVKHSLLPVASRWRHRYYCIQNHRPVQVGTLM